MKSFDELLRITRILLGPKGCPWDREQTMRTIRKNLLEETCEVIDAIHSDDNDRIREELGDLFFNALFLCELAEKEGRCNLDEVLQEMTAKLIRRHPHVFGENQAEDAQAALASWEASKNKEKHVAERKSILDGIPKSLPSLARAQKVVKKAKKLTISIPLSQISFESEQELGKLLLELVATAEEKGVDIEHALRESLGSLEQQIRSIES